MEKLCGICMPILMAAGLAMPCPFWRCPWDTNYRCPCDPQHRRILGDGDVQAATLAEGSEKNQGGEKWEKLGHEVIMAVMAIDGSHGVMAMRLAFWMMISWDDDKGLCDILWLSKEGCPARI